MTRYACATNVHNGHASSKAAAHCFYVRDTREQLAAADASLGVGHVWTRVACPAYRSLNPADCTCGGAK